MSAPPALRRLVYLGSPEVAVAPLRALVDAGWDVALVVSQPDRKRGRGGRLRPTPVKAAALELGLPVTDRVDDVLDAGADLGVVVAFGRLVRPHVLAELAMVNLHFSLLPRWRGAAPVERAILAGDEETGVCLMRLEEGLDTGPVYACERVGIGAEETADELRTRLVGLGSELLLAALEAGLGVPVPQEGEPTYAAKLGPEELHLEWSRPAVELHRVVRVGGAWTTFRGRRLKVHRARLVPPGAEAPSPGVLEATVVGTGEEALELVEVQPEGRAPQPAPAWLRGARPAPGERLGT
ncbi:MAG: methionyl-tRNA formyltransferase [Actinobacteria bacterium]|nr:methionyl-tRNA formyltransferase [Actinomycetota bacterium]